MLLVLPLLWSVGVCSACEKTPEAKAGATLASSAALPTRFSPDTKLILGDPQGQYIVDHIGQPEYPSDWSEAIALTQETIDSLAEVSHKPRFDAHKLFDLRFQGVAADVARAGATAMRSRDQERTSTDRSRTKESRP